MGEDHEEELIWLAGVMRDVTVGAGEKAYRVSGIVIPADGHGERIVANWWLEDHGRKE